MKSRVSKSPCVICKGQVYMQFAALPEAFPHTKLSQLPEGVIGTRRHAHKRVHRSWDLKCPFQSVYREHDISRGPHSTTSQAQRKATPQVLCFRRPPVNPSAYSAATR